MEYQSELLNLKQPWKEVKKGLGRNKETREHKEGRSSAGALGTTLRCVEGQGGEREECLALHLPGRVRGLLPGELPSWCYGALGFMFGKAPL